ncbi:FliH/SctL family protein [Conexibacter sp. DBS9H8]|uniref:FliH/SctL family protein n=1 Tax=Conexibacter sp. DBS9H8 TaxID=2937801 RepID=UPI0020106A89|nr:FliH/SctL family protein [Conexibacter sp. DBS9H8]
MSTISRYRFAPLEGEAPHRVEDVLSAAWAEAEQVRARAYAEGFAAGEATGREAFEAEARAALAMLSAAADTFVTERATAVAELEGQAGELGLAIAEQIVAGAIAVEPERIVEVCAAALRRLADRRRVTVAVNPDDLELVVSHSGTLRTGLGGIETLEVQSDRRVGRGGVIVRTADAVIDATVATQLRRAREVVETALREPEPSDPDQRDA